MSEVSLGISLRNPAALSDGGDWLKLSQQPWEDESGDAFQEWLYETGQVPDDPAALFALHDEFKSGCSADGSFQTRIFVETSRPDLPYNLVADNGDLSDRVTESQTIARTYRIAEPARALSEFEGRIDTLHSYEWKLCYELDPSGYYVEATNLPIVTIQNGKPVWGRPVVGSLRLRFTAEVDYYDLVVHPLDDTADNPDDILQCVVMALWAGPPEVLEIESPEKVGNCSLTSLLDVTGADGEDGEDGEDGDEDVACVKLIVEVDACSGEELNRWEEPIECPQ